MKGAYAWRTMLEHGVRLIFNSDLPGSDHNIFYGLHAAITRRDKNLQPPKGWYLNRTPNLRKRCGLTPPGRLTPHFEKTRPALLHQAGGPISLSWTSTRSTSAKNLQRNYLQEASN
ncbi:MAG: hypothetical protein IPJ07_17080 [Acidobacteria bacterium]|nr:hypothetical protein [Acidobacteriota bacterium]